MAISSTIDIQIDGGSATSTDAIVTGTVAPFNREETYLSAFLFGGL